MRSPPLAFSDFEKSPVRSRSVGMVMKFVRGSRFRHCSHAVNVNSLFFLMGLPRVAPQMWLRTWLGACVTALLTALNTGFRPK